MGRLLNIKQFIFRRRTLRHLWDLFLINIGAYFVYMFVRKFLIADIEPLAFTNAIKVTSFEISSGIFLEAGWQAWVIDRSEALVIFFNWAYIITFWPIIIATAVFVYFMDRERYFYYRGLVLLSFVFALLIFALFPLAPPRYLPEHGIVDTIRQFGPPGYGGRDMAFFYNAFAAMPSLHFGWTILFGVFFLRTKRIWLKPFGIIYPTLTLLAITVTGNHYIVDALGGASIILASYLVYTGFLRTRSRYPELVRAARGQIGRANAYAHATVTHWKGQAQVALTRTKLKLGRPRRGPTLRRT